MAKVHCTFANTPPGLSPIHPWTFAIGECPIGESLIGERPITHEGRERKEINRDNRNEVQVQSVREKKHNMLTLLCLVSHG
jgi:hypothetical protein